MSDGLTIFTTKPDHAASKQFACQPNGSWKSTAFDLGFWFRPNTYEVTNINEVAEAIEVIREDHRAFILRGDVIPDVAAKCALEPDHWIAKRKNPNPKDDIPVSLIEVPRRWIMVDVDKYPLSPHADLIADPVAVIDEAIRALLPAQFHAAECFWQLSSSCGFPSAAGILKVHLFFYLSEAKDNAYLRAWFKHHAPCIDIAPFNAVQPHFVADPVIEGGADPVPQRTGWRHGDRAKVDLPIWDAAANPRPHAASGKGAAANGLHAASIAEALARLGDGEGLDGFHAPLLAAAMQYAIRCQKGGTRDDAEFIAKLRTAIEAAPKSDGRDFTDYLSDAYLHRIIDGGIALIENAAKADTDDTAPDPLKLPPGFGFAKGGLYYTAPRNGDVEPEPIWVAAQFSIRGECENGIGGDWGVVMAWRDRGGHWHEWIIPRALLHGDADAIAARLEAQGLRCGYSTTAQGALLRFLATVRPERRLLAVETGGWHGDSYLLPDGSVFGGGDVMLRPELQRADLSCAEAGTLDEWQDQVGRYAVGNSRIALFIAAAFAGSLLELLSEPSGGFHAFGKSQSGKTTAAIAAASVNGKGARDGALVQWRTTDNGLEAVAARSSDGVLVLDEISQADAKEAGNCIYMLANGQGKQRADRTGAARARTNWRILFLSTGEVTLSQRMSDAGRKAMTGMENRMIDIPADAGAGLGVFENLHGFAGGGHLADHLRDASARVYGTAGRAFLSRLVEERACDAYGLCATLRALRSQFIQQHVPAGADGQVRSVAGRFAVVATAGELATAWNILPWEEGEATRVAAICFQAWLTERGGSGAGEVQGAIQQVRAFLEAHGNSRFAEIHTTAQTDACGKPTNSPDVDSIFGMDRTINRCGWRKKDATGHWSYFVLPEMWKSEVCKGIDPTNAAKALADRGWLQREGKNLTCKVTVPDHGRPRVYVVSGALLEGEAD